MFLGAAAVAAVAMVFAGCGGAPPELEPTPTRTAQQPVFGSLDEAFEAAVAAYQRYLDVWNQIAAEGGAAPERLLQVMEAGELADQEIAFFEGLASSGQRVAGAATFDNPRLLQYVDASSLIQIYACSDISAARLLDATGNDITPERDEWIPLMISLSVGTSADVRVAEREVWDRPGIC